MGKFALLAAVVSAYGSAQAAPLISVAEISLPEPAGGIPEITDRARVEALIRSTVEDRSAVTRYVERRDALAIPSPGSAVLVAMGGGLAFLGTPRHRRAAGSGSGAASVVRVA